MPTNYTITQRYNSAHKVKPFASHNGNLYRFGQIKWFCQCLQPFEILMIRFMNFI
jgi:hypothetical protein